MLLKRITQKTTKINNLRSNLFKIMIAINTSIENRYCFTSAIMPPHQKKTRKLEKDSFSDIETDNRQPRTYDPGVKKNR